MSSFLLSCHFSHPLLPPTSPLPPPVNLSGPLVVTRCQVVLPAWSSSSPSPFFVFLLLLFLLSIRACGHFAVTVKCHCGFSLLSTDPETWPSFNPPPVALQSPSSFLSWSLLPSSCLPSFAVLCFILFYASSFFLLPNPFMKLCQLFLLLPVPLCSCFSFWCNSFFPLSFLRPTVPWSVSPFLLFSLCPCHLLYAYRLLIPSIVPLNSFLHPRVSSPVVLLFFLLICNPHPSNPPPVPFLYHLPPSPYHPIPCFWQERQL